MKNQIRNFAVVIATLLFSSCHDSQSHHHQKVEDEHKDAHRGVVVFSEHDAHHAGLRVDTVQLGSFSKVIKVSGKIQSTRDGEQTIVSPVGGVVYFGGKNLTEGMYLKNGETLLSISSKKMQDGDLGVRLSADYEAAKKEYDRASELMKDNIISQKHFDQAKLDYLKSKNAYDAYYANSSEFGINVGSPISGYLKTLLVKQGEFVSVGDPIAVVTQNKRVQLYADVPEKFAKYLPQIRTANFKVSYEDTLYKLSDMAGKLLSYAKTTNKESFMLPVIFEFDNVCDVLPGSYADVYLLARKEENVITIPMTSLLEEQGLYFVYVRTLPEHYEKREVHIGSNDGERVVVLKGLSVGDCVVSKGARHIKIAESSSVIPEGHSHNH